MYLFYGISTWFFFNSSCANPPGPLTDPEALPDERVGPLPVLRDQRGVVALLARILTLALEADPLADERRDDHLEALPRGGALRAPHQPVDAQPDDEQMGDHRGHPGILHCPPQRTHKPGGVSAPAPKRPLCESEQISTSHAAERKRVIPAVGSWRVREKSLPPHIQVVQLQHRHVGHLREFLVDVVAAVSEVAVASSLFLLLSLLRCRVGESAYIGLGERERRRGREGGEEKGWASPLWRNLAAGQPGWKCFPCWSFLLCCPCTDPALQIIAAQLRVSLRQYKKWCTDFL